MDDPKEPAAQPQLTKSARKRLKKKEKSLRAASQATEMKEKGENSAPEEQRVTNKKTENCIKSTIDKVTSKASGVSVQVPYTEETNIIAKLEDPCNLTESQTVVTEAGKFKRFIVDSATGELEDLESEVQGANDHKMDTRIGDIYHLKSDNLAQCDSILDSISDLRHALEVASGVLRKSVQLKKDISIGNHVVDSLTDPEAEIARTCGETPAITTELAGGDQKGKAPEKSKAEIKAERKARQEAQKAAKAAKITMQQKIGDVSIEKKAKVKPSSDCQDGTISEESGQKSKAQLRAERRAKQEAQRAAKAELLKEKKDGPVKHQVKRVPDSIKADEPGAEKRLAKKLASQQVPMRSMTKRKVPLFLHLHQYERDTALTESIWEAQIHPAIIRLGLQYAQGIVCGSNARAVALIHAFRKMISDYKTPPQKDLSRDLETRMKPCISFLQQCRPISVSMGNVIKFMKAEIRKIPDGMPDSKARSRLVELLQKYVKEKVTVAARVICEYTRSKITDGDVILTYGCSSLIEEVLVDSHSSGVQFRVVVADGRPRNEGREMLRRLVRKGLKCTYIHVNSLSYIMCEVTKVLLGAHALLANGCVMSRVGTSQVALVARVYNRPVLVCCETYKFCERVQTDSFVFNELGDPDDLVSSALTDWQNLPSLTLLNLTYDVTPPDLVSMVVTEQGMIPCTSVPVLLRESGYLILSNY